MNRIYLGSFDSYISPVGGLKGIFSPTDLRVNSRNLRLTWIPLIFKINLAKITRDRVMIDQCYLNSSLDWVFWINCEHFKIKFCNCGSPGNLEKQNINFFRLSQ